MHRPFSRLPHVLASSLSVVLLAGCPNAGTAPPVNPAQASPGASPAASAPATSSSPAGGTTSSPGTGSNGSGSGTATPAPGASTATSNPAPSGATTILQGRVYDEDGATVDGATVTVRSLDTRLPYSATAQSDGGNYVVNNVPAGVQIEVAVTQTGWTRRVRVTSLQPDVSVRNVLNFGAASAQDDEDKAGAAYFISDFPEISVATPGASPVTGDKLSYRVRFSEALDADNRALVEDSFSLDTSAAPTALVPATVVGGELSAALVIEDNSTFLDHSRRVTFTWNAENTEVAVAFDAPLRALDNDEKSYRFRLIRRAGDALIEDADGNTLGLTQPADGESYFAVKKANLAIQTASTTGEARWQDTHQRSSSFSVAEDNVDPSLVSINTTEERRTDKANNEFLRVDLLFSEPMRVYPDDKGFPKSVADVANYVFSFGEDPGDLDGVDMDDAPTDHTTGDVATEVAERDQIRFVAGGTTTNDDVFIEPSDSDPKEVSVFIPLNVIPDNFKVIKVMVKTTVTDPAGNTMSEANAQATSNTADNVAIGTI